MVTARENRRVGTIKRYASTADQKDDIGSVVDPDLIAVNNI